MRIGILTGGGDVPGLNPLIKSLVYRAVDEGFEILGFRRGWRGLLNYNPDDDECEEPCLLPLDKQNTRTIDRRGGTILHTSRLNPSRVQLEDVPGFLRSAGPLDLPLDLTPHILHVLQHLGIDMLVAIGGDDALGYAARLCREGFPVIAIPKTMDNDVFGTDYCIGFSTAVTRSVEIIHQFRTSAGSHERLAIVELFGRSSGETCLISSLLAGVDRVIISEVPFEAEKLARLLSGDRENNPSQYAMVAISEGARFVGEPESVTEERSTSIGTQTAEALQKIAKIDTIFQQAAYLMRSGTADSLDLMVAVNYANLAMDLVLRGQSGRMVALQGGRYTHVPVDTVTQGVKRVDVAELYDAENYRPRLRSVINKPMFLY